MNIGIMEKTLWSYGLHESVSALQGSIENVTIQ